MTCVTTGTEPPNANTFLRFLGGYCAWLESRIIFGVTPEIRWFQQNVKNDAFCFRRGLFIFNTVTTGKVRRERLFVKITLCFMFWARNYIRTFCKISEKELGSHVRTNHFRQAKTKSAKLRFFLSWCKISAGVTTRWNIPFNSNMKLASVSAPQRRVIWKQLLENTVVFTDSCRLVDRWGDQTTRCERIWAHRQDWCPGEQCRCPYRVCFSLCVKV